MMNDNPETEIRVERKHARPLQNRHPDLYQLQRREDQRLHAVEGVAEQPGAASRHGGDLREHGQGGRSHLGLRARLRPALARAGGLAGVRLQGGGWLQGGGLRFRQPGLAALRQAHRSEAASPQCGPARLHRGAEGQDHRPLPGEHRRGGRRDDGGRPRGRAAPHPG